MTRRRFGRSIAVVNDGVGGLYAGSPNGVGVAVICGTGSATAARSPDGRLWHSSFWQEPDGARQLAHKTLRAVYRADLGTGPPTGLTALVLAEYGQSTVEAVQHLITRRLDPAPFKAGTLVRLLLAEADRGDPVARRIVEEHGAGLGDCARVAARRVGIEGTAFPVVLAGSVFRGPARLLGDILFARVRAASPDAILMRSSFEPVVGALRLAFEQIGSAWDETTVANLTRTMPAPALFET
jgi:N-acetylglucosamine kinase-like BadF-type ATPase